MSKPIPNPPDRTAEDLERFRADCARVNAPKGTEADTIQGEQGGKARETIKPEPLLIKVDSTGTTVGNP